MFVQDLVLLYFLVHMQKLVMFIVLFVDCKQPQGRGHEPPHAVGPPGAVAAGVPVAVAAARSRPPVGLEGR